ncbi:hypothetical protein GOODEAATRI_032729, partial [Goodea atripinnis]
EPCLWTPRKGQEGVGNPGTSPQLPQQQLAGGEVYGDPPAAAMFVRPGLYAPRPPVWRNRRVPPEPQGEPSAFSCKARSGAIAPDTPGAEHGPM